MSMLLIVLYIETGWYHLTSKIPQIRIIIYGIHYRLKEKWKEKKKDNKRMHTNWEISITLFPIKLWNKK